MLDNSAYLFGAIFYLQAYLKGQRWMYRHIGFWDYVQRKSRCSGTLFTISLILYQEKRLGEGGDRTQTHVLGVLLVWDTICILKTRFPRAGSRFAARKPPRRVRVWTCLGLCLELSEASCDELYGTEWGFADDSVKFPWGFVASPKGCCRNSSGFLWEFC